MKRLQQKGKLRLLLFVLLGGFMTKYVRKDNGLYFIKKNAISIAKAFFYEDKVIIDIQNATSEYQIEKILAEARRAQQ